MTNTGINYTHPRRTAHVAGSVVLQAGQTVWLTGPRRGQLTTHVVERVSADGSKINYRKTR